MSKSSLISPKIRNSLSQARFFFDREGKKTIFVEGDKDYKMIKAYVNDNIRIDVLNGKPNVLHVEKLYTKDKYAIDKKYVMLMADIDYDIVSNACLSEVINYNVFCKNDGFLFNDLEIFIFNTNALKKIISNYGFYESESYFESFKKSVEKASRFFGKYRAADEVLKKKLGGNSILNGLDISGYFLIEGDDIIPNELEFIEQISNWSNRKELVDDLLIEADLLNERVTVSWGLSNGHDITEILASYLECKVNAKNNRSIRINRNQLELMLRIACDSQEYMDSPMGKDLNSFSII